ncbi:MAG: thiamine phosphate synthase [Pseudomonadota bacterium]
METPERPQLYLVSPPAFDLSGFPDMLARVLDAHPVACVRLALSTHDEDVLCRAADIVRERTHARDVALVIEQHVLLAQRLGLDGVHLTDGARSVRAARKELGDEAIVGAFCSHSRHDGMSAGENGADYVSFGPAEPSNLGDGSYADLDLFEWWSEVIEVPVVAEGVRDAARVAELAPHTDFFAFGDALWQSDNPVAVISALINTLG